jgi:type IX secretion system PorP/SprF family membrane protein
MKKIAMCAALIGCGISAIKAQHDTQISTYAFNQVVYNPAFAGNHERVEATVLQRSQFIGFKGAPTVWNVAVSSPFMILDTRHGAAFTLNSDAIGAFNKMHFAAAYTYWHDLPKANAKIGIGLSAGAVSYTLTPTWGGITDDAIPNSADASSAAFDANFGVFYQAQKFSAGLSCSHANNPQTLRLQSGKDALTVYRTFYLNGDYHWDTSVEELELLPSAMLMAVRMQVWQVTLGCHAFYMKKFWGGMSYRIGDALGISAGMLFKSLRFGLLYEYSLSKMIGYNYGTTEVFLSYLFDLNLKRKIKKYKSVRFM